MKTGCQRHVRPVAGPIEDPMAQYSCEQDPGTAPVAASQEISSGEERAPNNVHHQAVAPGKVIEVQRVDAGDAGSNADVLNADGDEGEDQQIGQQGSEHKGADGGFRRPAFSSETNGKVSDKHGLSLIAPW